MQNVPLPQECLVDCFWLLFPDWKFILTECSQVCRSWNTAVLSSKELWSRVSDLVPVRYRNEFPELTGLELIKHLFQLNQNWKNVSKLPQKPETIFKPNIPSPEVCHFTKDYMLAVEPTTIKCFRLSDRFHPEWNEAWHFEIPKCCAVNYSSKYFAVSDHLGRVEQLFDLSDRSLYCRIPSQTVAFDDQILCCLDFDDTGVFVFSVKDLQNVENYEPKLLSQIKWKYYFTIHVERYLYYFPESKKAVVLLNHYDFPHLSIFSIPGAEKSPMDTWKISPKWIGSNFIIFYDPFSEKCLRFDVLSKSMDYWDPFIGKAVFVGSIGYELGLWDPSGMFELRNENGKLCAQWSQWGSIRRWDSIRFCPIQTGGNLQLMDLTPR